MRKKLSWQEELILSSIISKYLKLETMSDNNEFKFPPEVFTSEMNAIQIRTIPVEKRVVQDCSYSLYFGENKHVVEEYNNQLLCWRKSGNQFYYHVPILQTSESVTLIIRNFPIDSDLIEFDVSLIWLDWVDKLRSMMRD